MLAKKRYKLNDSPRGRAFLIGSMADVQALLALLLVMTMAMVIAPKNSKTAAQSTKRPPNVVNDQPTPISLLLRVELSRGVAN